MDQEQSYAENENENNVEFKKGPWTAAEDALLMTFVSENGARAWNTAHILHPGLRRCGKSCRLRYLNQLRRDLRKGPLTPQEEQIILLTHATQGNQWSKIAMMLPGRTDNTVKNFIYMTRKKLKRHAHSSPNYHIDSPSDEPPSKRYESAVPQSGYGFHYLSNINSTSPLSSNSVSDRSKPHHNNRFAESQFLSNGNTDLDNISRSPLKFSGYSNGYHNHINRAISPATGHQYIIEDLASPRYNSDISTSSPEYRLENHSFRTPLMNSSSPFSPTPSINSNTLYMSNSSKDIRNKRIISHSMPNKDPLCSLTSPTSAFREDCASTGTQILSRPPQTHIQKIDSMDHQILPTNAHLITDSVYHNPINPFTDPLNVTSFPIMELPSVQLSNICSQNIDLFDHNFSGGKLHTLFNDQNCLMSEVKQHTLFHDNSILPNNGNCQLNDITNTQNTLRLDNNRSTQFPTHKRQDLDLIEAFMPNSASPSSSLTSSQLISDMKLEMLQHQDMICGSLLTSQTSNPLDGTLASMFCSWGSMPAACNI